MCETSDPDRSRSRSLPQVKCGVCHELLLRGQKEEHEKVCLGRVCRPLAAKNPAAAARAAAQARLAGFNGTREPKLAALRGGANKNGKDSADIVPPHKENAAPSHPVHARRKPPAPDVPRARLSPRRTRRARRPAPAPAPAPDSLEDSDKGLDLKERLKKHEGMATLKPNPHKVYIGDRAEVGGRKGTVMFVGPAEFAGGGVGCRHAPDEKRSTSECDGKYDGERLFRCKAGFGIFVPVEDVKKLEEETDGDDWESLPGPAGSSLAERFGYDPVDALEHVVGQSAAKQKIQAIVNALQVNHRRVQAGGRAEPAPHVVLAGAAGSGKSMLARLVAHIVSECDGRDTVPSCVPLAPTSWRSAAGPDEPPSSSRSSARRRRGGVLLIDNFHRMLPTSDAGNVRESPGMEAMEALAAEVERRARKAGKGVVLILAGEADGIAAARRLCPPSTRCSPRPSCFPFRPAEVVRLVDRMASERGFTLADGLVDDRRLESHVAEAARCADPTRRNAHLARSLLEAAINRQTERVFTLGTIGKDTLTQLSLGDFLGEADSEGAVAGSDAQRMQDDTEKALADLEKVVGLDGVKDFIKSLRAQLLVEKERCCGFTVHRRGASSIWSSPGTRARGRPPWRGSSPTYSARWACFAAGISWRRIGPRSWRGTADRRRSRPRLWCRRRLEGCSSWTRRTRSSPGNAIRSGRRRWTR